jgi:hypothetical protein
MPTRAPKTLAAPEAGSAEVRTPSARDASLRRLSRAKRSLFAGAATLTGVLVAVAASAFPGRSIRAAGAGAGGTSNSASRAAEGASGGAGGESSGEASGLQRPAEEPTSAPTEGSASSGAAPEAPVVSGGS